MPTTFDQQAILLVDDEDFSRAMVGQMLHRLGFGSVTVAADGFEAIAHLNTRPLTAVLTDFRMPGFTGLQLLKAIRTGQTKAYRNLPCAMLTSYAERNLVGLAIVLDVDTFLAKPVSFDTLNKHLSRLFQYRFEPQPVNTYEAVAVEYAAPHLAIPPRPTGPAQTAAAPVPRQPAGLAARPSAPEIIDDLVPPVVLPAAPTSQPAAREAARGGEAKSGVVKVNLADIPEDAILARDLVGSSGILLLAAGTPFKRRYAKRLEELQEAVDHAWIVDESAATGG